MYLVHYSYTNNKATL